jgi:hypothetical protein
MFSNEFYKKLTDLATSVGLKPEDLLLVSTIESGLDPAARNKNGNAVGLFQAMPATLKGFGYKGNYSDFQNESAESQLDFVKQYITKAAAMAGGKFNSAAHVYVANFFPVALQLPGVKNGDPSTVIIEKDPITQKYKNISLEFERKVYKANSGLDQDKDGKITFGDFIKITNAAKGNKKYQIAVNELHNGSTDATQTKESMPSTDSYLDKIIDSFKSATASKFKYLPKHKIAIKLAGKLEDSIKFANILSLVLDDKLLSSTSVHSDKNSVELECVINGDKSLCVQAVDNVSKVVLDYYRPTVALKLIKQASSLPVIDNKFESLMLRKFELNKFASKK